MRPILWTFLVFALTFATNAPAGPLPMPGPPVPPVPAPTPEKAKWTCTGPVYDCRGCKDDDCSFKGECAHAEGHGKREDKARADAGWECTAQLDDRAPGLMWECFGLDRLTCTEDK
jgi:hypothetical protein